MDQVKRRVEVYCEQCGQAGGARPGQMKWRAVNSLYAGWRTLLASSEGALDGIGPWQAQWQRTEGDVAFAHPWPALARDDPAEAAAEDYRTSPAPASSVGYAATSGPGPLGCDPAALPPLRTNWLELLKKATTSPR